MKAKIKAFFTDMNRSTAFVCIAVWIIFMTWFIALLPQPPAALVFPVFVTWLVTSIGGVFWLFSRIKRDTRDRGYF